MKFGPWAGELGWEICWAIPLLRHLRTLNGWDHLTVAAPVGHEYLWGDVPDEYVPIETDGGARFAEGTVLSDFDPRGWLPPSELWRLYGHPERRYLTTTSVGYPAPKEWRPYSAQPEDVADVLLAVRPPKNGDHLKSWPIEYTAKLAALLMCRGLRVAMIGGSDNQSLPDVLDLRGIPFRRLAGVIRGAGCVVGPSSGPLHFAHLCRACVVTWYSSDVPRNVDFRYRYPEAWNPFGASLTWVETEPGVFPEPESVMEAIG